MQGKRLAGITLLLISVTWLPGHSQDYIKYGQIDPKYFTEEKCSFDTTANAYFIFNEQTSIFFYNERNIEYAPTGLLVHGTDYRYNVHLHRAIKFIGEDAVSTWGNFSYSYNPKYEKIENVRGFTYNMENGKLVKSKLEKNQIVYEAVSETRKTLKVSMPNIKKGAVMELEVDISSDDFYTSGPWQIQHTIPVEKSILVLKRPEYFNYNRIFKGYYPLKPKYSELLVEVPITVKVQSQGSTNSEKRTITYREYTEEYLVEKLPAFPIEPYLSTPRNYMSSLMFELSFTNFPNSVKETFNSSWEAVNTQLLEDDNFGRQISNTGFLKDQAEALKKNATDNQTLINSCFEYVRNNITCNNLIGIFCDETIKDVFKAKEGDVPGINLLLTALLREAGIKAYPVILSTRSNGMIQEIYPSISDFNYVICMAESDGKKILMDASDKYLSMDLLDPACLNGKGRIIDPSRSGWIELTNTKNAYRRNAVWNVLLEKDGVAKAKLEESHENIAGYIVRDRIRDKGSYEKYMEDQNRPDDGQTIISYSVENQDIITQPLNQKVEMVLDKGYNKGDLIICPPLYIEAMSDNPFKLLERTYPVEFDYPYYENVSVRTVVPDGYKVESLPANIDLSILNGAISYGFRITREENVIVAQYEYKLNKMIFLPADYAQVREFFRKMIENQNESFVLVKTEI
jgi:hypothetical protein